MMLSELNKKDRSKGMITNNELVCSITKDICKEDIKTFDDLIHHVIDKYGDKGITTVAAKTLFFKELLDSNYRNWRERI